MFMRTLTCPFFNLLTGSSSFSFTKLILTEERVENGIRSRKILVAASSSVVKKTFNNKKETNVVYSQKGRGKNDCNQSVAVVLISNPAPVQQQQQGNQRRSDILKRKFTKINMSLSQEFQHFLKGELITLQDPPQNPNTSSPKYNPNAKCAYHSNSQGTTPITVGP